MLHERGRTTEALARGEDGSAAQEERDLVERRSHGDLFALRGSTVRVVGEVVVVDLSVIMSNYMQMGGDAGLNAPDLQQGRPSPPAHLSR